MQLMSVTGGAQLAAANDSATIVVVASGHPRGLFQFTGPPTVDVTRQQNRVTSPLLSVIEGGQNLRFIDADHSYQRNVMNISFIVTLH